jgi:hypothetical protein
MTSKIVQPTYKTKLPSNGKSVQYRPFVVKEEKALLLALQENDIDTLASAIKNIVFCCTDGKVDPSAVPYYDIEYLFLQIRSKSIGELIELIGNCDCGPDKKTEFIIDIGNVYLEPKPSGNRNIKIQDTIYTIEFRHPSIDDFVRTIAKIDSEEASLIVANCMVKVWTDDEVMNWSDDEKFEFVESMTTKQQRAISEFLSDMPKVNLPASYTCVHCNKQNPNVLSGFENFFV